jgi:energy-coupling factor transporter transmembrane protein EcfT
MKHHMVAIRPSNSRTWLLFAIAGIYLVFGIYTFSHASLSWLSSVVFIIGALLLLIAWFKYHRGYPAWLIISDTGIQLPFMVHGSVPWSSILEIKPYQSPWFLTEDWGLRFKVDRSVRFRPLGVIASLTFSRSDPSRALLVSLQNMDLDLTCAELCDKLNSIRQLPHQERGDALAHLGQRVTP